MVALRGIWGLGFVVVAACVGGPQDYGTPPPDAAHSDAWAGDGNDSFDEADPIELGGPSTAGEFETVGDRDYYVFEGSAGQWLVIDARGDGSVRVFPLVTLHDAIETQVARGGAVTTRLPEDGTYYVVVEDIFEDGGLPGATYSLSLVEPVDGENNIYFDIESGDDAASARFVPVAELQFISLLGAFDHEGDLDVAAFSVNWPRHEGIFAGAQRGGPMGNGATSEVGIQWITPSSGDEVIARIDARYEFLLPPLPSPGDYLLWTERADTAPGANDFYVTSLQKGFSEFAEELEAPGTLGINDSIVLADANGEFRAVSVGSPAGVTAYLPLGDIDYVAVELPALVTLTATCDAERFGSGLVGFRGELRDRNGNVLANATEPDPVWLEADILQAGRYYLRLSASGQSPDVTGNYARCSINILP